MLTSWPSSFLIAGVNRGDGQARGIAQPLVQRLAGERSLVAIFLPPGAADEAAHHALDVDALRASDMHRARQPVVAHRLGNRLLQSGSRWFGMIARGLREPPARHLREHGALPGNRRRQDHVEDAQAVGRDHQQRAVGELEGVAHLAAPEEVQVTDVGGAHHLHQLILPPARPASIASCGRRSIRSAALRCRRGQTETPVRLVDVGEVGLDVETVRDGRLRKRGGDLGVDRHQVAERAFIVARPGGERLHGAVGALARPLRLDDQRGEHLLREDDAAVQLDVRRHVLGLDAKPFDDARGETHDVVAERAGVGEDHALRRRVGDVALVPERDVLHRGHRVAAEHAREPADALAQDRDCACGASTTSPSGAARTAPRPRRPR